MICSCTGDLHAMAIHDLQPISSGALQAKTPEINEDYVTNALNSLLNKHRLSILQQDGEISFQYISEGEALK